MAKRNEKVAVQVVQFLAQHQSLIDAYAYAIVRDFHILEDVRQEVAIVVAKRWDTIDRDRSLKPWLRKVIRLVALEVARKARRQPVLLSDKALDAVSPHFDDREDSGRARDLRNSVVLRCVQRLSGAARHVVDARYWDGLECTEIARTIDRSVQSVYAILKRARIALASCIETAMKRQEAGQG